MLPRTDRGVEGGIPIHELKKDKYWQLLRHGKIINLHFQIISEDVSSLDSYRERTSSS